MTRDKMSGGCPDGMTYTQRDAATYHVTTNPRIIPALWYVWQ